MKKLFLMLFLAFAAVLTPMTASAACPTTTTYVAKSSDGDTAPITFKTSYSAMNTFGIYFFLDVTWKNTNWSGNHSWYVELWTPGGAHYQNLPFGAPDAPDTISPSLGTAITCGRRFELSQILYVAGTMIQTAGLYGTWTAKYWVDSVNVANYTFTITNP